MAQSHVGGGENLEAAEALADSSRAGALGFGWVGLSGFVSGPETVEVAPDAVRSGSNDPVQQEHHEPNPMSRPRIGEVISGNSTLPAKLPHCTAFGPAEAQAAPIRPPIRAWLLELGIARAHVIRFQAIARAAPRQGPWRRCSAPCCPGRSRCDSARHGGAEHQGPDEVGRRRQEDRVLGFERSGRHRGGDRVAVSWKPLM